jgi:hypothetical protein
MADRRRQPLAGPDNDWGENHLIEGLAELDAPNIARGGIRAEEAFRLTCRRLRLTLNGRPLLDQPSAIRRVWHSLLTGSIESVPRNIRDYFVIFPNPAEDPFLPPNLRRRLLTEEDAWRELHHIVRNPEVKSLNITVIGRSRFPSIFLCSE